MTRDLRSAMIYALGIRSGAEGDFDPYGALCAMFDVAHALYWLDPNSVPSAWQFSPGLGGDMDYAECTEGDGEGCPVHSDECREAYALLTACGVDLADPYGNEAGRAAERALIALGNELEPYAALSDV